METKQKVTLKTKLRICDTMSGRYYCVAAILCPINLKSPGSGCFFFIINAVCMSCRSGDLRDSATMPTAVKLETGLLYKM